MHVPHPVAVLLSLLLAFGACSAPPRPAGSPAGLRLPHGTVAARLVAAAYDPAAHEATCKPWHELYAPDGRLLTKGLGGTFPHHRGLFVGWNRVRCGERTFDFWHCRAGETQRLVALESGAADEQVARIDWYGGDGSLVLHERRRVVLRPLAADAFVLELDVELRTGGTDVRLDGDPHHAGCQFRALQAFAAAGAPPVRFLRPATARALADDVWADCPWTAAVLPFPAAEGGPVTVLRLEDPARPEARWSTRPYGRFGAMVAATLTATSPLRLRCRYVVALGERDLAWCARAAADSAVR